MIARLLVVSFFLESCYNFNTPITQPKPTKQGRSLTETQGRTRGTAREQSQQAQAREARALQVMEPTHAESKQPEKSPQPGVSKPNRRNNPSLLQNGQVPNTRPRLQPAPQKAKALASQKEVQASQQEAHEQRQASLKEKSLLAQGGHQVQLYQEDGQWLAKVKENLPADFSRTLRLPVYVEPGLKLEQVAGYNKAWHQQHIHVELGKSNIHPSGYVYIGSRGIKGGGVGGSKKAKSKNKTKNKTRRHSQRRVNPGAPVEPTLGAQHAKTNADQPQASQPGKGKGKLVERGQKSSFVSAQLAIDEARLQEEQAQLYTKLVAASQDQDVQLAHALISQLERSCKLDKRAQLAEQYLTQLKKDPKTKGLATVAGQALALGILSQRRRISHPLSS